MKDAIRDRLNARLGSDLVRDLFFISGTIEPPEPAPAAPPVADIAPSSARLVALPPIADATLASAFARIIEARARRIAQTRNARGSHRRRKKSR